MKTVLVTGASRGIGEAIACRFASEGGWNIIINCCSIAAALEKQECAFLAGKAHELGLEVLLEIHSKKELEYVNSTIDMVGVNNRNLGTFVTDIENSFRLASALPKDTLLVSESGISSPDTVKRLREAGFRGFLIGENFMKTDNPGKALGEFIKQLN